MRAPSESLHDHPFFSEGIQTTVCLKKVIVWKSGVEAQIEAAWGEAEVAFFDTHFLINRGWYEAEKEYDFILVGIAYEAHPAQDMKIPFTPNPDQIAWERLIAERDGLPPPEVREVINLSGIALFLPVKGWDIDDYSFRGPVKSVKTIQDFLGQAGWKVRITVMRFDGLDADLDMIITKRSWLADEPPAAGQDIEGRLWLQGQLWSSHS